MDQQLLDCRRVQEFSILSAIKAQSAQGALYTLIFNALSQPQRHQRGAIIKLCKQQGFTTERAATALKVMEMADWIKTIADGLEVIVFLSEHAKLNGGAKL